MSSSPSFTYLEENMQEAQDHIDMLSTHSIQNMADCQTCALSDRDSDLTHMMREIDEDCSRVLIDSLNNQVDSYTWTSS
ncbi:unnamed protein product [Auanema sp. JU1783]|nr:unnamed protein product [Auanema sp. JU1783]